MTGFELKMEEAAQRISDGKTQLREAKTHQVNPSPLTRFAWGMVEQRLSNATAYLNQARGFWNRSS